MPAHEALTRRDQFQVKNQLKQDKEDKKKTKEETNKTKAKKNNKKGESKKKVKQTKQSSNKKEKGDHKARGRSTQKTESQGSSKTRSTTVSRGKRTTLTGVSSRSAKASRVAKAFQNRKADTDDTPSLETPAQPATTVPSRKRLRQKTPEQDLSAATAVEVQPKGAAKTKAKAKATPKAKTPKAKAAAYTRRQRKAQEEYIPYPHMKARVEEILLQCQTKGKCCEAHSPDVLDLAKNDANSDFQKSIYWSRQAVGLKVPRDQLPVAERGTGNKPKQICYFGGGPCAYVNMALMDHYVPS